jgi:D-alanyl-lipoteichoic acid acyltransferase DltB (MBOAT superfamily)
MLFTSPAFLFLFLPSVWLGYQLARRRSVPATQWWLLTASLVFYAGWDWRFLPILIASVLINFLIGSHLLRTPSRGWLTVGIAVNLSAIALFKYADFGIATINALTGAGVGYVSLVLPLGISFFTFQQIAYLVDCHQGKAERTGPVEYALFVTFFPQLIAGPIVHHREMLHQLRVPAPVTDRLFAQGVFLLVSGLAKKVLIADSLAPWADIGFANPEGIGLIGAWTATLAYSLQLYFDFSGYSEMAMGLACLFGITLPTNFYSPYKATNIADFWRRWHITLGRFLRQYLYIPLGGSRHGSSRTLIALSVTMLLGGLWHGAGWTFVLWGALHGLFLCVYYGWQKIGWRLPNRVGQGLTLLAVILAWVPFRADSWADAVAMWHGLAGLNGLHAPPFIAQLLQDVGFSVVARHEHYVGWEIIVLLCGLAFVTTQPNVHERWAQYQPSWRSFAAVTASAVAAVAIIGRDSAWLYGAF